MSNENRVRKRKHQETASPARYTPKDMLAYKSLRKKQKSQFDKKFYIGDIPIDDEEYVELKNYLNTQIHRVPASTPIANSPLLCMALVQIGMKKYDGNFWGNVGRELNCRISIQTQSFLGRSFILTLKKHDKYILNENERVNSILFHTFVSDYYANGLFELLFQYYRRDLERDINRNTRDQMQALMDTLDRTSKMDEGSGEAMAAKLSGKTEVEKGSQSYKLRHHTLDAISANIGHSKQRLRRIIRLLDKAFWNDAVPANPSARLTKLFIKWVHSSPGFNEDHKLYKGGQIRNRGKKHFSSPYLYCDMKSTEFFVVLPAQIVNEEYAYNLSWKIRTIENEYFVSVDTYQAVTGFKSREERYKLKPSELFGRIEFRLVSDSTVVRRLSDIPSAEVRYFDLDGDFALRLFKIPMCVYTRPESQLRSPALIGKVDLGDLTRWDFEFEDGDVLVLPDGSSMLVGETYNQGLLPRGKVSGMSCRSEGEPLPVYSSVPTLVLTIAPAKVNGTAFYVNGARYQLSNCKSVDFELKDSKGERAFLISLDQFTGVKNYEINRVVVDVPGSNYAQPFLFALATGLSIEFDGAPYVYNDRAAIVFPEGVAVSPLTQVQRLKEENGFVFDLSADNSSLPVALGNRGLQAYIDVPVFLWSLDENDWNISPMGDVWISELPTYIYLKAPSKETRFFVDMEIDDSDDEQQTIASSIRADGIQTVDLTRVRSWLTRDKIAYDIHMRLNGKDYSFAKVYVKSYVASCEISADFERGEIICSTEIIGKASYYLSIDNQTTGETIVDKYLFDGKSAHIPDGFLNGKYSIEIFEAEEDESGFDEPDYYSIYSRIETIIDKSNLSGKHIDLRGFRPINSGLLTSPSKNYWIRDLKKESLLEYSGMMFTRSDCSAPFKVKVIFNSISDLRYMNIQRWYEDDEEPDALMFDRSRKEFVEEEESGLHGRAKYLRYQMLYREKYIFFGILRDELPSFSSFSSRKMARHSSSFSCPASASIGSSEPAFESIKIEQMQLSFCTYNCLRRAQLYTAGEIASKTKNEMLKIRNLGKKLFEEVFNEMKRLGCPEDAPIMASSITHNIHETNAQAAPITLGHEAIDSQLSAAKSYAASDT